MIFRAKNYEELSKEELYEILKSRAQIFIVERGMRCQDLDDNDPKSRHFFFWEDSRVVAYIRAFYLDEEHTAVKIGRVLTLTHGVGLGAKLFAAVKADLKENMPCQKICVDAQKHAVGFYEKMGFKPRSGEFLEEGVVHVAMELKT